jgi:inorganic pyrophosphatase
MNLLHRPHQLDRAKHECKAIIETPKGSRNKFDFDPDYGAFTIASVLAEGFSFPFDFGFIPSTLADDGDPTDVMLLMDSPAFPGCVVDVRLIGVIEAMQREKDGTETRNDRLLGVSTVSTQHANIRNLDGLQEELLREIEQFFVFYNKTRGREFRVLARRGPEEAVKIIERAAECFQAEHSM